MRAPAPLLQDAHEINRWLLHHFGADADPLTVRILHHSLQVLELVALALRGLDRVERVERADEHLLCLRVELRLAQQLDRLTEAQLVHILGVADRIGRQLGGWQRTLEPV